MQLQNKSAKLFLLFIIISLLPTQLTHSLTLGDTLYTYPEDVPVLDGYLESTIWFTSTKLDIKLYDHEDQNNIMFISMMAVYNEDNGTISFGVTVPDETIGSDMFVIVFKTNSTAPLVYYDDVWTFSDNHDAKLFYPNLNVSADSFTDATMSGGPMDTTVGGIDNIQGNGTHTGTQYTFELTTPLSSGDAIGHDIDLGKKDVIDFFVMYADDGLVYSQIRTLDQDSDYCTLKVGKKGLLGPEPWFIVASLISTFVVFSFISRKRKKSSSK